MNLTWLKKILWRPVFKCITKYKKWYAQKYIIPPYEEKRQIIKDHQKQFGVNVLVETGTFMGDTVAALKSDFSKVISIELSEELALKAQQRFANEPTVKIIHGNSGALMANLLREINAPCIFWLDGHYSSEFFLGDTYIKTAKGNKLTPVLEELGAIFSSPHKEKHVILIDDARCFDGTNDYPTIPELKDFVSKFNAKLKVEIKRDIIRILPN
ncbi:hypothetical protein A3860_00595 [Niastella vici]|uniref:Methyltransferase n=1 Tax=Niastella vici TaxID=1703345 RepID=A0A1V9G8J2_9BACT|nr:hypothetical protein [Niastella vici]OQP66902.1 hypothetical protein A3860_00595 [Niastella vici]